MSDQTPAIAELLSSIREKKPLIHHITNWVSANDSANMMLAVGALPVMAPAEQEVEEMVESAGALVLNIGTLTEDLITAMLLAGKRANERNIPIVLDPVGAGATRFRTQNALRLLGELRIAVLRGNAAEVGSLVGIEGETRGVASISAGASPEVIARTAAQEFKCTVAVTGPRDVIIDGANEPHRHAEVTNGHPLLAAITGSGCMSTSMVGAFLAAVDDPWLATIAGLVTIGIAGEVAAPASSGPGTFRAHLLDAVAAMTPEQIRTRQKVDLL